MVVIKLEMPRLITAMITPFDDKLQVNYAKAAEVAEYLAKNGTEGIVVAGTTGESPVLSDEEKLRLFATVKEQVGSRVSVWAGTGSNNTQHSVNSLTWRRYQRKKESFYYECRLKLEKISKKILDYNLHCPTFRLGRSNITVEEEMSKVTNVIESALKP
jgi:dihydroorotate dehydrogenase